MRKSNPAVNIVIFVICFVLIGTVISVFGGHNNTTTTGDTTVNNGQVVRISLDEFSGWSSLLYANGGLKTTSNSIYGKMGLNIEFVVANDATESSDALIKGELQGAGYTINRYAYLQNKFDEAGVSVIMPYITNYSNGGDGIICIADIKNVADLVGHKIAVPKYSEAQTLLEYLVQNSGLTDEEIINIHQNIVYYNTADETAEAFFAGDVDVAATWEPYITQAASSTKSRILFDTSMGTNLIMDGIIFRSDFAESNSEFIVNFIDGALQANSVYGTDCNSLKAFPSFALMSDDDIKGMCEGASVATWADNVSLLTGNAVTMYEEMSKIWISIGEKAYPDKASKAFTNAYVNQLMGKYPTNDYTSFAFTSEGRQAAQQISNNSALISMRLDIKFEVDSYIISQESYDDLREFAKVAEILNGVYIQIEGNTAHVDGVDGKDFSYKRATSVAKYLQALGIDTSRFIIVGNGDTNPIDTNTTEEGRANNRRTDVFFKVIGY